MQRKFWERSILKKRRSPHHPVVFNYSNSKLHLIFHKIDSKDINTVLEVGCGNGFFSLQLNQKFDYLIGLDFSSLMLSLLKKENIPLICADALFLPLKNYSFDLVFCANLLHHVDSIKVALKEMKRVSKKYITIIEPNRQNPLMYLFFRLKKEEDETKIFSLQNLINLLHEEHFTIIDAFSMGLISPNQTSRFLLPFFRVFEAKKSRFGLYNIIICI
ncbi:MAG: class I SAM-dependent methyltransferase [Candidatus Helarchaeota archaeon]